MLGLMPRTMGISKACKQEVPSEKRCEERVSIALRLTCLPDTSDAEWAKEKASLSIVGFCKGSLAVRCPRSSSLRCITTFGVVLMSALFVVSSNRHSEFETAVHCGSWKSTGLLDKGPLKSVLSGGVLWGLRINTRLATEGRDDTTGLVLTPSGFLGPKILPTASDDIDRTLECSSMRYSIAWEKGL